MKTREDLLNLFTGEQKLLQVTPEITLLKDGPEFGAVEALVDIGEEKVEFTLWNHQDDAGSFCAKRNVYLNESLQNVVAARILLTRYLGLPEDYTATKVVVETKVETRVVEITKMVEDNELIGMNKAYEKILLNGNKKITIE